MSEVEIKRYRMGKERGGRKMREGEKGIDEEMQREI